MPVKEILLLGNPLLRQNAEAIKKTEVGQYHQVIDDLKDTLEKFRADNGFGRGISAPQIGVSKRIIFVQFKDIYCMINPEIIQSSNQMVTLWDDCFSFPNLMVKLKRHKEIDVKYFDQYGDEKYFHASDELSELIQHEVDHLNGILAIDRAIDSKHIIFRSEWNKIHSGKHKFNLQY